MFLAAVAVTLVAIATAGPSSASVSRVEFARLQCVGPGKLYAYAPAGNGTYSSYPFAKLKIQSHIYSWNTTTQRWVYLASSGWIAHATTINQASNRGWGYIVGAGFPYSAWIPYSTESLISDAQAYYEWNVPRGFYYAVVTEVWDTSDATSVFITNSTSSINGSTYCSA
jgi:hypothetical protein